MCLGPIKLIARDSPVEKSGTCHMVWRKERDPQQVLEEEEEQEEAEEEESNLKPEAGCVFHASGLSKVPIVRRYLTE